jgi:hypothetical protein
LKNGQKLKLGDAHVTPRNIQEVQVSKLGDAVTPEFPEIQSAHYVFHHNPIIIVVIHIT